MLLHPDQPAAIMTHVLKKQLETIGSAGVHVIKWRPRDQLGIIGSTDDRHAHRRLL